MRIQDDMAREQEAGKSNATQMEKDTRLQSCVEVNHDKSASETAIDSEDDHNGSIADELRANPNVLKTGRKLLGVMDMRQQMISEELKEGLNESLLHYRRMNKHPQQREGAKTIIHYSGKSWKFEDEYRVW